MEWTRILAYITGTMDQELLLSDQTVGNVLRHHGVSSAPAPRKQTITWAAFIRAHLARREVSMPESGPDSEVSQALDWSAPPSRADIPNPPVCELRPVWALPRDFPRTRTFKRSKAYCVTHLPARITVVHGVFSQQMEA
jgi:hypothetical protein